MSEPGTPVGVGWNTHGTPKDVPPDRPKKIEGVEPHPIIPCVYYDELPRLDALAPKGRVIGGGDDDAVKETR